MSPSRVLLAGCGYVASAAAKTLLGKGCEVFGVRRRVEALPAGVIPVACDLLADDYSQLPAQVDALVWALSPTRGEAGYEAAYVEGPRRLLAHLEGRGDDLERALLVASTSVWHSDEGAEFDEGSPPCPIDYRGARVLEGEAVFDACPYPSASLRLGGIYGPGRARVLERARAGELAPPRATRYSNRIHRDDAAAAIVHLLEAPELSPRYIVVDDEPADLRDVYTWISEWLDAPLAAAQESVGRGSKRCSNAHLRASGWVPRFPNYRVGYEDIARASDADQREGEIETQHARPSDPSSQADLR